MNIKPRILIVEDEVQIRRLLSMTLSPQFRLSEVSNGKEALSSAEAMRPDIVILDLGLPDISGLEVLKGIREWSELPIIILTAMNDSETIVGALNSGADDYITKPFESTELIARINVVLRRSIKKENAQSIFVAKHIKVDLALRTVYKNGVEVKLTSTEYDLLRFFIKNVNKVMTNKQILREVWGPSVLENAQYPRVYVRHLRQKLEENSNKPVLFLNESGVGYRLKD
jgi:two-component system KDP operon response regulator KdpE